MQQNHEKAQRDSPPKGSLASHFRAHLKTSTFHSKTLTTSCSPSGIGKGTRNRTVILNKNQETDYISFLFTFLLFIHLIYRNQYKPGVCQTRDASCLSVLGGMFGEQRHMCTDRRTHHSPLSLPKSSPIQESTPLVYIGFKIILQIYSLKILQM